MYVALVVSRIVGLTITRQRVYPRLRTDGCSAKLVEDEPLE